MLKLRGFGDFKASRDVCIEGVVPNMIDDLHPGAWLIGEVIEEGQVSIMFDQQYAWKIAKAGSLVRFVSNSIRQSTFQVLTLINKHWEHSHGHITFLNKGFMLHNLL